MSSKFFTNKCENTLFEKFKGIAQNMANFHSLHAVVGFFRSSGYFKLREVLENVGKIQILVGINIDNIFRKHNKAMLMFSNEEDAKNIYSQDFINDIQTAHYNADVEKGISQLCEDLHIGKMEMKIHATKNLHAKFYICLPENHSSHSDGWVIMGSSNISESGLGLTQAPRYELNVAMKDYDDVVFCKTEFEELWKEAIPLTANDIEKSKNKTHVGADPTPYELYIKVLIDSFGDQVEDDFSITLPDGVYDLKYQKDAVIQGYQMLCEHNGFFLADVVGLGKTIVATMIAKRFVEDNGKDTNILVVHPPALENSWREAVKQFGLSKKTQFISNGSLDKIINGKNNYKDKESFDLVIVDEAHSFRNDSSNRYDELQRICKSRRQNAGLIKGDQKKVMLLSATPLNNRPNDLFNQILLFQDARGCTIEGINNLQAFFAPLIERYNKIMHDRNMPTEAKEDTKKIDAIYEEIRNKVLDKITIRRTRHNIWNDDFYRKDLEEQKIKFPEILPPNDLTYQLSPLLSKLFYNTLKVLTEKLHYARYRAVEFLSDEHSHKFKNPINIGENLVGIYRVHMVKRLESSFDAFKRSLNTFLRITEDMIKMFDERKIIIAPELKIKDLQAKGWELDRIIEYAIEKGYDENDVVFSPENFVPKKEEELLPLLQSDQKTLQELKYQWEKITEDPKLDLFIDKLQTELFGKERNPTGKLIIFSESVDTVNYLEKTLKERLKREDILKVSSENRKADADKIRKNFDANLKEEEQSNEYNIVITSDVLAEGVNLHRANVIVNYDSPWNAPRLMQRIGRVNRIGSVAGKIYNYMFYPSAEGDAQIQLYKNALIKLQGFHSALGEDAQIYSKEEIVREFKLFNTQVKDKVDKQLELLREVRELYNTDRLLYKKIKALPMKSRTTRNATPQTKSETTIAFISSPRKIEYYRVTNENVDKIDFLDAAEILKAKKEEPIADFASIAKVHFAQVNLALKHFEAESIVQQDADSLNAQLKTKDRNTLQSLKFLRDYKSITEDDDIKKMCSELSRLIQQGVYSQLKSKVKAVAEKCKVGTNNQYEIDRQLEVIHRNYHVNIDTNSNINNTEPNIVISETFR
jgi:superfamily II DNA/RNA helicase